MSYELGEIAISEGGAGMGMTQKLLSATEDSLTWIVNVRYIYFFGLVVDEERGVGCHSAVGGLTDNIAKLHNSNIIIHIGRLDNLF